MPRRLSWRHVIYHGEVLGFLAAWAVALVLALAAGPPTSQPRAASEGDVVRKAD